MPRPIRKPSFKHAQRSAPVLPRVSWGKFAPMADYWGNVIPRFYQLETFAHVMENLIHGDDRFLCPSIQQVLGPAPVVTLNIELFQEGAYQLIFRVHAANQRKKAGMFALVAAKQEGNVSRLAETEHRNLMLLHRRAPDIVVKPYLGGVVFLPDRYGRKDKGRKLYVYVTQWLSGFHELGIDRTLQFFINTRTPHLFSKAETETLKKQMVGIIARLYDPETATGIELPQIASGDFVVTAPGRGGLKLKLIACRRVLRRVTPQKLIDAVIHAEWMWGDRPFRLVPNDPRDFVDGLIGAVGKDMTREWLRAYREAVAAGKCRRSSYAVEVSRISL